MSQDLELLLRSPKSPTLEELFLLATQEELVMAVAEKLRAAYGKQAKPRELGVLGVEFATTSVGDALAQLAVPGVPVVSGIVFLYKFFRKLLTVEDGL